MSKIDQITVGQFVDRLSQYPREARLLFCLDEPNVITDMEIASLYRQALNEGGSVCIDFEPTASRIGKSLNDG